MKAASDPGVPPTRVNRFVQEEAVKSVGRAVNEDLAERGPVMLTRAPSAAHLKTIAGATEAVLGIAKFATLIAAVADTLTGSTTVAGASVAMRKRAHNTERQSIKRHGRLKSSVHM